MDLHRQARAEATPRELRRSAPPNQIVQKPKTGQNDGPMHGYFQDAALEAGGAAPADVRPFLPWNLTAEQRKNLAEVGGIASESG